MTFHGGKIFGGVLAGAVLWAAGAHAEPVLAQFGGPGCYSRTYDDGHLARHPNQMVRRIALTRSGHQEGRGYTTLSLRFQMRRGGEVFVSDVYCKPRGQGATCLVESDGGSFGIALKGSDLRLSASGVSVEGNSGFGEFGSDDRLFLLRKGRCF